MHETISDATQSSTIASLQYSFHSDPRAAHYFLVCFYWHRAIVLYFCNLLWLFDIHYFLLASLARHTKHFGFFNQTHVRTVSAWPSSAVHIINGKPERNAMHTFIYYYYSVSIMYCLTAVAVDAVIVADVVYGG